VAAAYALHALFCLALLLKLNTESNVSWWVVFIPLFAASVQAMPIRAWMIIHGGQVMLQQVGPPPPLTASAGLIIQYELILAVRIRTHFCDHAAGLVQLAGNLVTKILFAWALDAGKLAGSVAVRVVFIPIWVAWAATFALNFAKDRSERSLVTLNDLFNIFLLMAAFKADGASNFSWRLVFIIPWVYFAVVCMLASVLVSALVLARAWSRSKELLLPIGFTTFLLGMIPMFVGFTALSERLDGDTGVAYKAILAPILVAFAVMALGCAGVTFGLRAKEAVRLSLLASGQVWTAHEAVARRLHGEREAAQQHIDSLPEEEVARMVAEMMANKTKPTNLIRVGATLYKRIVDPGQTATPVGSPDSMVAPKSTVVGPPGHTLDIEAGISQQPSTPRPADLPGAVPTAAVAVVSNVRPGSGSAAAGGLSQQGSQTQAQGGASSTTQGQPHDRSAVGRTGSSRGAAGREGWVASVDEESPAVMPVASTAGDAAAASGAAGAAAAAGHSVPRPAPSRPQSALRRAAPSGPGAGTANALAGLLDGRFLGLTTNNAVMDVNDSGPDDSTCVICYEENVARFVLLECGHGGFCKRCANLLFVRPPNECPTCRARIEQVVELEDPLGPVGTTARVKQ